MFESLIGRLSAVFSKITSRGVLSEKDIDDAMREIRIALLEADVSLPVARDFISRVKAEALGEKVIKSVQPGQMVVKIVNDELVKLLGEGDTELNLNAPAPVCIMLVGLQGSGKTTTAAKIAYRLKKKSRRVLLASLDVYRPAAQEQLAQLGASEGVDVLPVIKGQMPLEITKRALAEAKKGVYDVLILDTAGRLQIDDVLMQEAAEVKKLASPAETLLVADAMTGQEACNVARGFNEKVGVTGLVLTRMDGSARAGAVLSMKAVSGAPVKFLGTGEKISDLEEFHADRVAGRILDKGDVVSLVEKAAESIDRAEAEKAAAKMMKGSFDLNDMLGQMRQLKKLGSPGSILGMLPGMAKFKSQIEESGVCDTLMKKQEAMILSMTKEERADPGIIKASRKRRIAEGAGVQVHDVNVLLKSYMQMSAMMKKMGRPGLMSAVSGMLKKNPLGNFPGGFNKRFPF